MSKHYLALGTRQKMILFSLGFLVVIHWASYIWLGGSNINESTEEFGNLPLQMGVVFAMHGFFLLAVKSSFEIDNGTSKNIVNGIAASILLFAVSFYTSGTILGVTELVLYEPIMISVLFVFALSLYVSRKPANLGATET